MSCSTTTLGSGKTIYLCTDPKCLNNHLSIKRTPIQIQSPLYMTKEAELEILKKDLIWFNLNMNHYKRKIETCEKRIHELES